MPVCDSLSIRGQLGRLIDPFDQISQLAYNQDHRAEQVLLPGNIAVDLVYDGAGFLQQITDPLGQSIDFSIRSTEVVTFTVCDSQGDDCAEIELPTGNNKRLRQLDDQLGRETEFEYDKNGNLTKRVYPDGSFVAYAGYDTDGNPGEVTNRRQQPIQYTWNDRGQLVRKDHADGTFEFFAYDERGNLIAAIDDAARPNSHTMRQTG